MITGDIIYYENLIKMNKNDSREQMEKKMSLKDICDNYHVYYGYENDKGWGGSYHEYEEFSI